MTVAELKALLNNYPEDMEVMKAEKSGDHWGTILALPIRRVSKRTIVYSAYHECDKIPLDVDEDDTNVREVVIL
jgi:hypothetical protein